jgi:glycerol-3-phosphate O-acyltransferase
MSRLNPLSDFLDEPRLERMRRFNSERDTIAALTVQRVVDARRRRARSPRDLELVLNEVCFNEQQRFAKGHLDDDDRALRARLGRVRRSLRRMSDVELIDTLTDLTRIYVRDIVGNFNPAVYAFASRAAPVLMSLIFSPFHMGRSVADLSQLRERVLIEGTVADLERLSRHGTLVVVPTHLSNLDSIAIGFALERSRLPPCTYGAGKNLFTNPLLAYFMRNLGAYRVDRRIRNDLYKDTLKAYSSVLLERGYHSLFFPGGTRSRSGMIESHLKLGLLGSAVEATVELMRGEGGRPIYIVPATINYHLVLEAATLVEDYLKERGQHRYIIEDDESTQITRVARYLSDMLRSEASMSIHFSDPLDVLGHRVSPEGISLDDRGRPVELRPFFTAPHNGTGADVVHDAARDAEYTRELGERIAEAWHADVHVLSTHLVAFVLFRQLARAVGTEDVFRIIRGAPDGGGEGGEGLPVAGVLAAIERMLDALKAMALGRKLRLGVRVASAAPEQLLEEALGFFHLFHTRPVARREGATVLVEDRSLCCYYHNRLVGFGLEAIP